MVRPEFPALFDAFYRPQRAIGNFLWRLAGLQNWTHHFMPTGHTRGCPNDYKPLETCLCWGGVDLRTKQQSPEGRFYLKTHLAIWLFGIHWYEFWKNRYYAWANTASDIERFLVPSRWNCEYCSSPWGKHDPKCPMLEVPEDTCTCLPGQAPHEPGCQLWVANDVYDNYQDPMYDDYPYDEPDPPDWAEANQR